MEKNWYYVVDGVRYGPVTFSELHALTMAGAVKPLDLVRWISNVTRSLAFWRRSDIKNAISSGLTE